ncbi:MAG: PT domain-containing protein [Clostridia bacterium]|nr:PT domain-containing protein [Clostridia bacterium]
MKKFIIILLTLSLAISVAACKRNGGEADASPKPSAAPTDAPTDEPTTEPTAEPEPEASLTEQINAIFEAAPENQMMLGEATAVDLSDADTAKYYLGVSDLSPVKEAVFIEPMMSSIAFSAVLIELTEGADVEAFKSAIVAESDEVKWLCVWADTLIANNSGNTVFFIMTSSELAEGYMAAFESLHEGDIGQRVVRTTAE